MMEDDSLLLDYLADKLSVQERSEVELRLEKDDALLERLRFLSRPSEEEKTVLTSLKNPEIRSDEIRELIEHLKNQPNQPNITPHDLNWQSLMAHPKKEDSIKVLGRLGEYQVLGHLAIGSMAHVLRAWDPLLEREVAIKILFPSLAAREVERERFLREARAAAKLGHPHILPIHFVEDKDACPWFVMPMVDGPSLEQVFKRTDGPQPFEAVLSFSRQLFSALQAAHERELIHRDIRPKNVLLSQDLTHLWLTDFGLSKREGDQESDLSSLAGVLYMAATGEKPFPKRTSFSTSNATDYEQLIPAKALNPNLPEWFDSLLSELLSKPPEERLASAEAVVQLLNPPSKFNLIRSARKAIAKALDGLVAIGIRRDQR